VKISLVSPPSPPEYRVSRGLMGGFGMAVNPELLYPPIELAHVASALESDGHEVAIVDADALSAGADEVLRRVRGQAPGLAILDSSSTSLDLDLALAGSIRRALDVPVGILGSQVTYTPREVFAGDNVDLVVRGEPEATVREVARRVAAGQALAGTAGITWRDPSGAVVDEPEREKIADLDSLPLPARHLLDNQVYRFPGIAGAITTVKSSRGCPLDCSFCGYTLAQGLRFRFRSPANVVRELTEVARTHGVGHVVFRDPIFTTRKDRVQQICDGMIAENLGLEWQCETAVKTVDRPLLERMAAAGCRHISFGVESGNAEIQQKHCGSKLLDGKKALDTPRIVDVFRACRELGIETRAFCMLGFPEETPAMIAETFELVEACDPDQVQFCAVTAYPGTPLYKMLHGTREFDFAQMTGFNALEGNEHMSAAEIEKKIREGYRRFYRRPRRLVRELRSPVRFAGKALRYFTLFAKRA
jgi:radical SAM superfamily enzyme YgiQ (UPF0313 family)